MAAAAAMPSSRAAKRAAPLALAAALGALMGAAAGAAPPPRPGGANASAAPPRCAGHVSAGYEHSCAITQAGALLCWGSDDHGQLDVPPGYAWARVSAGKYHTCGVTTSATLVCWGADKHHEAESLASHAWSDVSAGAGSTCALTTTGRLACWGDNQYGQAQVPAGVFTAVSAGFGDTVCALETSRAIACWGRASDGQTAVPPGVEWAAVSTGWLHACGLAAARRPGARPADAADADAAAPAATDDGVGAIVCWGNNDFGQLDVPPLRRSEGSRWVGVAAGHSYTCGLTDAGALRCWGHLPFGLDRVPPGVRWSELSAGYYHACGFGGSGSGSGSGPGGGLRCWGLDYDGQAEVPEGFDFSAACARAGVPAEHKGGRGGCPARQLAHVGAGYATRAAVVAECQRVGCGYYVWHRPRGAPPAAAPSAAEAAEAGGRAWFCRDDYYEATGNAADWPEWEVGRLKLGCAASDGDVRLSAYPRGEIYISEGGVWATLCGALDLPTAGVICRQLGYERAALTYTYWGQEYAYLGVHAPRCTGAEPRLDACARREVDCAAAGGHARDQGIECAGGRAAAAGGPDAAECGTAPIARHAHTPLGATLGASRGGELAVSHDHHGRTVAPADLAASLGPAALRARARARARGGAWRARRGGAAALLLGAGALAALALGAAVGRRRRGRAAAALALV